MHVASLMSPGEICKSDTYGANNSDLFMVSAPV